jgi:hypothetical protein
MCVRASCVKARELLFVCVRERAGDRAVIVHQPANVNVYA